MLSSTILSYITFVYFAFFIQNSQIKGPDLPVPMSWQPRFRASLNL